MSRPPEQYDAGTEALREIADAHREGRAPDPVALAVVAAAVPALLQHGSARERGERFCKALGIAATRGTGAPQKDSAGDWLRVARVVGFMLERERVLIADNMPKRKASKQAVDDAVEKYGVSKSRAQHWRTDHRDEIAALLEEARADLQRQIEEARAWENTLQSMLKRSVQRK